MTKAKKWAAAGLSVALCACSAVGLNSVFASAEETAPVEETCSLGDFPYHTGYSGFDWYTAKSNVDYKLMAGVFDADAEEYGLQAFDTWDNSNTVTLSSLSGLTVINWKWTFAANSSAVVVFRSKMEGTIAVDMSAASKFGGWNEPNNAIYTVHRLNASDQTLDTLVNYVHGTDTVSGTQANSFTTASVYDLEIQVSAGDIVYYEIGSLAAGRNLQNLYDACITATPAPEENDPLKGYGTQIDSFVATLTRENYTEESWSVIEGFVAEFKNGTYADEDAVKTAFDGAKANIQAVACDSVSYFISDYGAKLDALVSERYAEDYREETWTAVNGYVSSFRSGEYDDKEAVITAYESAAESIRSTAMDADPESQTYALGNFPKQTGRNGFGYQERNNVSYKLMAGLFDESAEGYGLQAFDTWDGGNKITLSAVSGLSVTNWRWDFAENSSVVVVIRSKTEGIVSFNMSAASSFKGWNEPYNAVYTVHRFNAADQTLDTLVNYVHGTDTVSGAKVDDFTNAAVYDLKVAVKAGDVIYYEIGSLKARNMLNHQEAQIVAVPLTDETAGAVFGDMLDGYVSGLAQSDYTQASWDSIGQIVTAFKGGTYETASSASSAYDEAVAHIEAIEPDSVAYFGAKLDGMVSSLNEEDFEEESWTAINAKVAQFKAGEYADGPAIRTAYEQAKSEIEGIAPDSLSFLRADLLGKIEAYYQSLNEEYFNAEDWTAITDAYNFYTQNQEDKTDKAQLQAFYDEQLAVMKAVRANKQEISYLDFPSLMSANEFNWIEGDVVDVKLFTGSVDGGLKEFDTYDEKNNKMYNTELFAEDPTCYVQTWKWFVGIGKGVIVAYRANSDCSITVTSTRKADGGGSGWTTDTLLNAYIVRNGVAKLIGTKKAPATDEDFGGTYYVKEGDILYIEFTTKTALSARNAEFPYGTKAVADSNGFDEELYTEQNHDLPVEVQNRIEEKKTALETYLSELKEDDYSATNWVLLEDYIAQFVQKCDTEVATVADVDALYENILASMKAVTTKAQAAEELAAVLEGYVADLQAEYDSLVKNYKYTSENKAKLDKALEDGVAAVRSAKTKAAGNTAKSGALSAMRAVEKSEKGGLSAGAIAGIAVGGAAVVAGAVVAAVVVRKKSKK